MQRFQEGDPTIEPPPLPEPQQNWIQGTSGQGTPYWYTQDGQYSDTNPNSIEPPQGNPQTNAVNPNLFYGNGDPSGSGTTSGTTDPGSKNPAQVIHDLGYDPSDPRSFDPKGFGSGVPTQKGIGTAANIAGNFFFPGLGLVTGKAASWITSMLQSKMSANQVNKVVAGALADGSAPEGMPSTSGGGGKGFSFNFPQGLGGLGKPLGYFPPTGGFGTGDPGNYNPTGPMGGQGTAGIVDASSPAGGGSFFGGRANWGMNLPGSTYNLGASGGGLAPGMANLYLHGQGMQNWAQGQGYNSVGDWLRQTGFSLGGANPSGAGLSGAGRPMTSSR